MTTKLPDMKAPSTWIATWLGSGFMRPAPGTWGSAAALPFIIGVDYIAGLTGLLAFIAITTLIGFWSAARFEQQTGIHDSKTVVIDEVAGQAIALIPATALATLSPLLCFIGFLLFRIFDITKPWPIGYIDKRIKGAAGVMIDDLVAGIFAAICLTGLIYAKLI